MTYLSWKTKGWGGLVLLVLQHIKYPVLQVGIVFKVYFDLLLMLFVLQFLFFISHTHTPAPLVCDFTQSD